MAMAAPCPRAVVEDAREQVPGPKAKARRHSCPECGLKFLKPAHVRQHALVHRQQRLHLCPHDGCGRAYKRHDHLTRHLPVHDGILFQCPMTGCVASFTTKANMLRHGKEQHSAGHGRGLGRASAKRQRAEPASQPEASQSSPAAGASQPRAAEVAGSSVAGRGGSARMAAEGHGEGGVKAGRGRRGRRTRAWECEDAQHDPCSGSESGRESGEEGEVRNQEGIPRGGWEGFRREAREEVRTGEEEARGGEDEEGQEEEKEEEEEEGEEEEEEEEEEEGEEGEEDEEDEEGGGISEEKEDKEEVGEGEEGKEEGEVEEEDGGLLQEEEEEEEGGEVDEEEEGGREVSGGKEEEKVEEEEVDEKEDESCSEGVNEEESEEEEGDEEDEEEKEEAAKDVRVAPSKDPCRSSSFSRLERMSSCVRAHRTSSMGTKMPAAHLVCHQSVAGRQAQQLGPVRPWAHSHHLASAGLGTHPLEAGVGAGGSSKGSSLCAERAGGVAGASRDRGAASTKGHSRGTNSQGFCGITGLSSPVHRCDERTGRRAAEKNPEGCLGGRSGGGHQDAAAGAAVPASPGSKGGGLSQAQAEALAQAQARGEGRVDLQGVGGTTERGGGGSLWVGSGDAFFCGLCMLQFPGQAELQQHGAEQHRVVPCPECGRGISGARLQRHRRERHGVRGSEKGKAWQGPPGQRREHACPVEFCGKALSTAYNLQQHVRSVHWMERAFLCSLCHNSFATKQSLQRHVRNLHTWRLQELHNSESEDEAEVCDSADWDSLDREEDGRPQQCSGMGGRKRPRDDSPQKKTGRKPYEAKRFLVMLFNDSTKRTST